jgi:hypothetical protein
LFAWVTGVQLFALALAYLLGAPPLVITPAASVGAVLAVVTVVLGRRGLLTPPRRRAIWALSLAAAAGLGAFALHGVGVEPRPFVWWELTRSMCTHPEDWNVLDLFLAAFCPVWLLFDVMAAVGHTMQVGARLAALVLGPVAVLSFALAVRTLLGELRRA